MVKQNSTIDRQRRSNLMARLNELGKSPTIKDMPELKKIGQELKDIDSRNSKANEETGLMRFFKKTIKESGN